MPPPIAAVGTQASRRMGVFSESEDAKKPLLSLAVWPRGTGGERFGALRKNPKDSLRRREDPGAVASDESRDCRDRLDAAPEALRQDVDPTSCASLKCTRLFEAT